MNYLLIITTLLSLKLMASDCTEINLYADAHLNQNIQNQGDMHTCYAHSLSTLYTQEFKEEVNPYWMAYIHKDRLLHWSPRNLNFSLLSWAFSDFKKRGNCSPQFLQTRLKELKQNTNYSDDQYFYFLQIYFKEEKDPQKLLQYLVEHSKDFEIRWIQSDIKKLVGNIESFASKNLFDFFREVVFQDCNQSTEVNGELRSIARGFESNEDLQKEVMKVLSQNKALSIGLCPSAAYKFTEDDIQTKPRLLKAVKGKCGAHYVNIVGSREKENQCELLIRNSYPGFWAHKSLECFCQRGDQTFNCKKEQLAKDDKVLGCWIPSEKILTNTYDLSYFE